METLGLTVASHLAQALASLLLAAFIALILRSRRRAYLRQLALAFTALAVFLGAGGINLTLNDPTYPSHGLKTLLYALSLGMLFPHLFWLWQGSRGAVGQATPAPALEYSIALALACTGILMAVGGGMLPHRDQAMTYALLHSTVPYSIAAIVYLALAVRLFRVRALTGGMPISPLIAVAAFTAFGLYLLQLAVGGPWMLANAAFAGHAQLSGLAGLIILMIMALSFLSWLLETEQQRSAQALDKARAAERRLSYFRSHDPATGLPNRRQVQELLGQELQKLRQNPDSRLAVLVLGVHRFKVMSESMGWHRTEDMLRDLTQRIREHLPEHFLLGRTGERDFALIMPRIHNRERAARRAEEVLARLRRPFVHAGRELVLNISGGLSLAPDDAADPTEMLGLAIKAQLRAADRGQQLCIHQPETDAVATRDLLEVEADLRRACRQGEFKLHFQPLISIPERCISGFEALLRWEHPQHGLLGPDQFLEDAWALGLFDELEDRVFDLALQQLREWQEDLSLAAVGVAINISAHRFVRPEMPDRLAAKCRQQGIPPNRITLEITENSAIGDFEAALETITKLHDQGIKVSLDDFGTGYSALAHLQRLNVDYVKLDRSFVTDIESNPRQLALTRAVVELIHSLGMQVLAEGVETRAQLGHMIQCRVDYVQGFLLGEPKPAEHYRQVLESREISAFDY